MCTANTTRRTTSAAAMMIAMAQAAQRALRLQPVPSLRHSFQNRALKAQMQLAVPGPDRSR